MVAFPERRPKPVSAPRDTYLRIARTLSDQIRADPEMDELPSVREVMTQHGVSRGVVLRAFKVLAFQDMAAPVPGARWRVTWRGGAVDERPLPARVAALIIDDRLEPGSVFYSEGVLCERLGVSRPTVRRALAELEASGVLKPGGQGKPRIVGSAP